MEVLCKKCKYINEIDIDSIKEEKIIGEIDKVHQFYEVNDYTFECKKCKEEITISFDYWEEINTGELLNGYENFYSLDGELV